VEHSIGVYKVQLPFAFLQTPCLCRQIACVQNLTVVALLFVVGMNDGSQVARNVRGQLAATYFF